MPIDAPELKKDAIRGYGAEVIFFDRAKDDLNLEEPVQVLSPAERLASLRIDEKVDPDRPEIDYSKEEFTVENQRFYLPKDV